MNMAVHTSKTEEQTVEAAIVAAGKTAARVTPAGIDNTIAGIFFFTAAHGAEQVAALEGRADQTPDELRLLTFCVLVLRNGFTVTGESACASPKNFDPQIGRDIAFKNAREKIWLLEGYLLKQRLHDGG